MPIRTRRTFLMPIVEPRHPKSKLKWSRQVKYQAYQLSSAWARCTKEENPSERVLDRSVVACVDSMKTGHFWAAIANATCAILSWGLGWAKKALHHFLDTNLIFSCTAN